MSQNEGQSQFIPKRCFFFSRKALENCFFLGGGESPAYFASTSFFCSWWKKSCSTYCLDFIPRDVASDVVRPLPFCRSVGNPEFSMSFPKWVRGSIHPRNLTWKQINAPKRKSLNPFGTVNSLKQIYPDWRFSCRNFHMCHIQLHTTHPHTHDIPNKNWSIIPKEPRKALFVFRNGRVF